MPSDRAQNIPQLDEQRGFSINEDAADLFGVRCQQFVDLALRPMTF